MKPPNRGGLGSRAGWRRCAPGAVAAQQPRKDPVFFLRPLSGTAWHLTVDSTAVNETGPLNIAAQTYVGVSGRRALGTPACARMSIRPMHVFKLDGSRCVASKAAPPGRTRLPPGEARQDSP